MSDKLLEFSTIANELAALVERELFCRKIRPTLSSEQLKDNSVGSLGGVPLAIERNSMLSSATVVKASLLAEFRSADLTKHLNDFSVQRLENWAREIAVKVARPYPMLTHPQELPMGTHCSVMGLSGGVQLRLVADYSIAYDILLWRIDCVASYDESLSDAQD